MVTEQPLRGRKRPALRIRGRSPRPTTGIPEIVPGRQELHSLSVNEITSLLLPLSLSVFMTVTACFKVLRFLFCIPRPQRVWNLICGLTFCGNNSWKQIWFPVVALSTQPTRLRRRLPGQALTVPRWAGRGVRRPLERPIPRLRAVVREVQRPAARRVQIEGAIPCS